MRAEDTISKQVGEVAYDVVNIPILYGFGSGFNDTLFLYNKAGLLIAVLHLEVIFTPNKALRPKSNAS